MPRVTVRAPIARISGTLPDPVHAGLSVFDQVKTGPLARRPRAAGGTPTSRQAATRAIFKATSAGWPTLTIAQRQAWRDAAYLYPVLDRMAMPTHLDGRQYYILVNAYRLRCAQALTPTPPTAFDWPIIAPADVRFSPDPTVPASYLISLKSSVAPSTGAFAAILELATLTCSGARVPQEYDYTLPDPGAPPANVLALPSTARVTIASSTDRWTSPAPTSLRARITALSPGYTPNPTRQAMVLTPSYGAAAWWPLSDTQASATVHSAPGMALDRTLGAGTAASHTITAPALRGFAFAGGASNWLALTSGYGNPDCDWLRLLTDNNCDFTLAFWVRTHWSNTALYPFYIQGRGQQSLLVSGTYGTNHVQATYYANTPNGEYIIIFNGSTQASWDNIWQHLVITRTGSTWRTYYQGAIANTLTPAAAGAQAWYYPAHVNDKFLLANVATAATPTRCDAADVRAYARALTGPEVALLYNAGAGRTLPLPPI
jgi:hypothetical protein